VKVWACLSWYDENPRWLAQTVASLAGFADHVIAVDGAYALYPGGRRSSGGEQAETIQAVAAQSGLGCTIHVPQTTWQGNEVEKRNAYLRIAGALGTVDEDWLFVIDADEVLTDVSPMARADVQASEALSGEVDRWTTDEMRCDYGRVPRLYRLLEHMEYGPTHFTLGGDLATGERVFLYGRGSAFDEEFVTPDDFTSQLRMEHKHHLRAMTRNLRMREYSDFRNRYDIEGWSKPNNKLDGMVHPQTR
jgi:hypothetical protein